MTSIRNVAANIPATPRPLPLAGLKFDRLSEEQLVQHIIQASRSHRGGWVATPNIDICRQVQDDAAKLTLVKSATLTVPDGMPLIWAARIRGERFPERVTGSSLIFSLTRAAASTGRSIYLLGGKPGVADRAGIELTRRYPHLKVAGAGSPPLGFDETPRGVRAVRDDLLLAEPDIVYVGLGFPKQERLITQLIPHLPHTWFIACGAAIPFAAGTLPRAPRWMQQTGLEWTFRLATEPRRLFRRYLIQDAPYAAGLLASSAAMRTRRQLPVMTSRFHHSRAAQGEPYRDSSRHLAR